VSPGSVVVFENLVDEKVVGVQTDNCDKNAGLKKTTRTEVREVVVYENLTKSDARCSVGQECGMRPEHEFPTAALAS
jgi:hypothetical protein